MIIRTEEQLNSALALLSKSLYWTYDIESTGLNVRREKVIGFGCCNPANLADKFYIITHEYVGGELIELLSKIQIQPVLNALKTKRLITHNGSFDSRITIHSVNTDLIKNIYVDTMLLAHTIDENKFNYGLKVLASDIFGDQEKEAQAAMLASIKANGGSEKEYYKADSNILATYALKDVELTAKLYNYYMPILRRKGLEQFFFDEVMALYVNVTIPMELKGIPVDVGFLRTTRTELENDLNKLQNQIQAQLTPHLDDFNRWYLNKEYAPALSGEFLNTLASLIAPPNWPRTKAGGYTFSAAQFKKLPELLKTDLWLYQTKAKRLPDSLVAQVQAKIFSNSGQLYAFNILSKHHLKKVFFDKLKEKALSHTDLGSPQVDDDFLEQMAAKYDWCKLLRTYNKLTKIKGTYVDRILDSQENGIFYPQYQQHRTTSGRYSGDLQQLPRIKTLEDENDPLFLEYNNRIRNFFVSSSGHKLIDADYSSLEVVVFADDAQDVALMDIIKNKYDLYSQMAILVNGLEGQYSADKKAPNFLKKHRPELRQDAKAFSLGIRYGLEAFKLHHDLGISIKAAEGIVKAYFTALPQLADRMKELKAHALTHGFVKSKGGRVRNFPWLVEKYKKYGNILFDHLELWKEYNETPAEYARMKKIAREVRGDVNNAYNFPIQSFAATIVSKASIEIAKEINTRGLKSYICMSTHDELCLLVPEAEVDEIKVLMQDKMENTTKLSVPLEAEPIVGTRYGDVK